MSAPILSLAAIADIHHGRDQETKLGSQAAELFRPFAEMIRRDPPDLVVDLGDRINDERDAETDRRNERAVAGWFDAMAVPRRHLMGNHDVNTLSVADNEAALGVGFGSSSMDLKGFHMIFWNCNVRHDADGHFVLPEADLDWLRRDLATAVLPTIICTHVPLDEGSMVGNYYFETRHRGRAHHTNAARARSVISACDRVVLCLAGHTHWNAHNCVDGVHYVTLHSLTESFTTHPHASGAYASVKVGASIEIEVFGRDPAYYRLPVERQGGGLWLRREPALA